MDRVADIYLRYYSNKTVAGCDRTNNLISEYQQEFSSSGYGYINLAEYIEKRGKSDCLKGFEDAKCYYDFLSELERSGTIREFEAFKYIDDKSFIQLSPLKVKVNAKEYEPNQKWHLIVSYLGLNVFLQCRTSIHSVICPELWMWMFETSENVFSENELNDVYNEAIRYKKKKCTKEEWKAFLKPYRQKLHDNILKIYEGGVSN